MSMLVLAALASLAAQPNGITLPELPRATVDVTMPAATASGRVLRVSAGGDLQAALDRARAGDVVELAAGATFTGNYVLPRRADTGWVIVRPAPSVALPALGTRINPRDPAFVAPPSIVTPNSAPALATAPGASGWRLVGLALSARDSVRTVYSLVRIGDGQATSAAQLPTRIVLDRVWIHGHETLHVQRCVQLNAGTAAIVDSYLAECHTKGQEGQGIGGWSGTGPWLVHDNTIEGGTIGMLVGGADPKAPELVPSDITVRGNHFVKPLAWRGRWSAKNAFELKDARRVLLEGNVLENNWVDAQNGFIVLFQALSQNNSAPWTTIADVTVRLNVIRNAPAGISILSRVAYPYGGRPALFPDSASRRFLITNNVFDRVGQPGSGNGRLFQLAGDLEDVTITRNTGAADHSALYLVPGAGGQGPMRRLVVTDNLLGRGNYGVYADGGGEGSAALGRLAPGATFAGNVIHDTGRGAPAANRYPPGNAFARGSSSVGADSWAVSAATARAVLP